MEVAQYLFYLLYLVKGFFCNFCAHFIHHFHKKFLGKKQYFLKTKNIKIHKINDWYIFILAASDGDRASISDELVY